MLEWSFLTSIVVGDGVVDGGGDEGSADGVAKVSGDVGDGTSTLTLLDPGTPVDAADASAIGKGKGICILYEWRFRCIIV